MPIGMSHDWRNCNLPSSTVELPSLPHILPKVSAFGRAPSTEKDARLDASNNDDMRFIRVRPVRANSCPTEDELVDAEWHSLVDMEMSRSPRSAHLQMREDRRQEQLQRAREKDRLKEMQAKLERYQRNEPEYETTSMGTGARQPRQTVPFSQKRHRRFWRSSKGRTTCRWRRKSRLKRSGCSSSDKN